MFFSIIYRCLLASTGLALGLALTPHATAGILVGQITPTGDPGVTINHDSISHTSIVGNAIQIMFAHSGGLIDQANYTAGLLTFNNVQSTTTTSPDGTPGSGSVRQEGFDGSITIKDLTNTTTILKAQFSNAYLSMSSGSANFSMLKQSGSLPLRGLELSSDVIALPTSGFFPAFTFSFIDFPRRSRFSFPDLKTFQITPGSYNATISDSDIPLPPQDVSSMPEPSTIISATIAAFMGLLALRRSHSMIAT